MRMRTNTQDVIFERKMRTFRMWKKRPGESDPPTLVQHALNQLRTSSCARRPRDSCVRAIGKIRML